MARTKKSEDTSFSETKTAENKSPHCTVCGAIFGTCDHTMEKPAQLPATVAVQQIAETLQQRRVEYPPPLAARRVALMKAIQPIAKADENKFHKYHYTSAVDVVDGVRMLMLDQGLYLDQEETGKKSMNDGVLTIEYAFTWGDVDGNRSHAMLWSGMCRLVDSKGTSDDKAAPKAHTQARKYFLIKNLDISTPDLSDSDAEKNGDKVPDNVKGTTRDPADEIPAQPVLINAKSASEWQRMFLVAIRRAKTAAEVMAWTKINEPRMAKLKEVDAPRHVATYEAILKRHQEFAEQPPPAQPGQKPLPPRADGQPNPTDGQSNTSSAQTAAASTSTAASTHAADPAEPGSKGSGQFGPMEEQSMLDGWGNMLSLATTIEEINSLQVNHLDKIKLRMSGMGYAKAQYAQQMRIKQIKAGHVSEDAWDFDSWFRTDFVGALSSCTEGDFERLDHVQQKVVIPARARMTDAQWKQTAKKFREEAARIKGDEL